MTLLNRHGGLGVLPILFAVAFFLPLAWTYGPKYFGSPIDVTPGTATKWFIFRSTEGPFLAAHSDECKLGMLVSAINPGDTIAWTSDLTIDAGVRVTSRIYLERLSDHAQIHMLTLPGGPVRRDGPRVTCYETPKDLQKGLYELHRVVQFFPPEGADFEKQWPVIPVEVR